MTMPGAGDSPRHVVSVLVPLYNHASTVERALNSILLSDTSRIELIICDDASKDRSFDVARDWVAEHGPRFVSAVVMRNAQNLGITRNLNRLMQAASGEFVTLIASDDELTAKAIDRQTQYLLMHASIDFVFANCGTIDSESRVVQDKVVSDRRAAWLQRTSCAMVDIVFNWSLPWSRLFARRAQFLRLGPYVGEHVFEDRWSGLSIAQTRRFGYLHMVVHLYRLRPQGLGTAGLDPQRMLGDMVDVEEQLTARSSGLLRVLLAIHTRAYIRTYRWEPIRVFYRVLQLIIMGAHRRAIPR